MTPIFPGTGCVNFRDQLRMQCYIFQLAYKACKYYNTAFMGLIDIAIVNASSCANTTKR
ncbi:hypothetical protein PHMEG_0002937 [Phytophthora megakarya]|uniref:Uncharacterized protein n=1 Tax=Phytophthora megakarya TaxID=4795 RepID=A0A225WZJ4_9STRA|nr:hypothetical protein PHMEG_0002937 [Phytophthora megakarya]